ncbi:dihydrofolate reductase family protein [Conexibacter sp. JD483]|uniref:dihydrofolate reductase family protein n=1 Tax=unclassified Conexibacter TaxID=2627773 RepID=UPI00271990ED|nr:MULTISPECIES: dihydrofolate reductase family protein [unclassified Conexibacter]MDO8189372.1 dihydrofolate reductase family protein [Conexibacter sp. CPCC 205706]MDO8201079.1 dihydrofolate reductase family protein [Conexibacter sp. CPCC 205762]MDR9372459.1 dihydrofolate reductase family protein [Conexibacter sp. JD483]
MTQVIADMAMSLDGFVADPDDRTDALHGWFFGGDVEVPTGTPGFAFRTSAASAEILREGIENVGAVVGGRRYYDLADAWGGRHPMNVPAFILTHEPPAEVPGEPGSFVFVTDGVESAIAQAKAAAGDRWVAVATPTLVRECLDAGLLDALNINLVPVVMGTGVPFFAELARAPVRLSDPVVSEGVGVTHLRYRVS